MGNRLLVIAIDALDSRQIAKYRDALPNLRRLSQSNPQITLHSVTPPDSDTAWASAYTGLNPARHGVVRFQDPLEKSAQKILAETGNEKVRGRAFWDIASQQGKQVRVLFPHLGFPAWPVNGLMIGRSALRNEVAAVPGGSVDDVTLSRLNVVKGMPGRNRIDYIRKNRELLEAQTAFAEAQLSRTDWDLFFVYSSVLDMIQHYFWDVCDEDDPGYPGANGFQGTIKDFYIRHDQMIGRLTAGIDPRTTIMVLSDHGHGSRPVRLMNTNEFLRQRGLFVLRGGAGSGSSARAIERTKNIGLKFLGEYGLGPLAIGILRWAPWIRRLYTRPVAVDWEKSTAYATNLSGIKAYAYNGIVVRRDRLGATAYERIRTGLLEDLLNLTALHSTEKIVRWASRREEVYTGPFLSSFPDILFELREGWGSGMTSDGSLYGRNDSRSLVPGSHTSDGAVFFLAHSPRPAARREMQLMDVAPTVLDVLGVESPGDWDGVSLFRNGAGTLG
jgi:predicted AlkP superfamily phosphohydrolase/phosphomutase